MMYRVTNFKQTITTISFTNWKSCFMPSEFLNEIYEKGEFSRISSVCFKMILKLQINVRTTQRKKKWHNFAKLESSLCFQVT